MYDSFKSLLPFMETKNIMEPVYEFDQIPDVRQLLNLPHIDEIKAELMEKVKNQTFKNGDILPTISAPVSRKRTNMSVTREVASDSESALMVEQQKPPNTMAIHSNYNADEAFRNRSKSTMMQ